MKVSWKFSEDQAVVELQPDTVMDKAMIDGLGNVTSASIKRNGTLQFIIAVPVQPAPKPIQDRAKDAVRDSQE